MFRFPLRYLALSLFGVLALTGAGLAQGRTIGQAGPASNSSPIRRAVVWYVDAAATGPASGLGWQLAFSDLQDALLRAVDGDQIWVAAGTYVPTTPGGPQSATFLIPTGVELYGGFLGNETDLAQRDPTANPTILSGDINGDDQWTPSFNIVTANSWNIATIRDAGPDTRVDGFEFQTGHLFGATGDLRFGAGLHLVNSSPTIADCSFSHCVGASGGAIHAAGGAPRIERCEFIKNYGSATSGRGGAVACDGALLTVVDSSFSQNIAEGVGGRGLGGAICNISGETSAEGCAFSSNTALPRGGLFGSFASQGGAVYAESGTVRIRDSRFLQNLSNLGGAVSSNLHAATTVELINSEFLYNDAIAVTTSSGFDVGDEAGAVFGSQLSHCDLVGCLVYGGTADNYGGALVGDLGSVSSSIFWGNSDRRGAIGVSQVKARRVYYSCVMNMLVGEPGEDPPDPAHFPGSTDLDPLFVDAGQGDFRLQPGSPCIDAADNTAFPASIVTDFDGLSRFVDDPAVADTGVGPGPIADMGPHERP